MPCLARRAYILVRVSSRPLVTRTTLSAVGKYVPDCGLSATTLKLVNTSYTAEAQYYAIGHKLATGSPSVANPMDFCEVSDLTAGANLPAAASIVDCGRLHIS